MVKNYSTFTTEVVFDNDGIEASVIDIMIARFPHVVTDIFKELDNETLTTCRNVSRIWCDTLDSDKRYWIRIIQRYCKDMKYSYPSWKKALKNTPIKYVKELSVCTRQFFKDDFNSRFHHWSPLQIVADQGNLELCKYILEKNTKPRIKYNRDFHYSHPLFMAAKKGQEEIYKVLMNDSEEKNPSDVNGNTPLHFAAERGVTNVCKLIVESVDNKNPAALNGCTPLHLAVKEGHLDIVRLIVETGVDKNTLFNGQTPLDMARSFKSNITLFKLFTFYKLLSKDKFQLCGIIFKDLDLDFLLLFFCVWFVMIYSLKIYNSMYLGFSLTIMTMVWLCIR